MKKLFVTMALLPLLLYHCKHNETKNTTENILLAKDVRITYLVNFDNEDNPEWTTSMDRDSFFKIVFKNVLDSNISVFGIGPIDFEDIENQNIMSAKEIPSRMAGWSENERPVNGLKEIYFYEKWDFNTQDLKFSKKVLGWCPINSWMKDSNELKKKIFYVYPKNDVKGRKIAESIVYEVPWSFEYPINNHGFDRLGFFTYIIEGIKKGKVIANDPIYLVDKSKRKFTPEELAKYIGQDLNPGLINFSLSSMLFEEDWYFDEQTFAIQKDVKSIAFVQDNYDPEKGTSTKKILFFIFPK